MTALHLDSASVEAVAQRVVELLRGEDAAGELIDAEEVARRYGVTRDWVYRNAQRLGCVRLSESEKGRLRFDPTVVAERLASAPTKVVAATRPGTSRSRARTSTLLPVRS